MADLEEIWRYALNTWSEKQADAYHADVVAAFEGIATGRKIGRPVDVRPGYLKYGVGSHFIYYRQSDAEIVVIRILHQRMDVGRHI